MPISHVTMHGWRFTPWKLFQLPKMQTAQDEQPEHLAFLMNNDSVDHILLSLLPFLTS